MILGFGFMVMFLAMILPVINKTDWNNIKSIILCTGIVAGLGVVMLGSLYLLRFGI